jgi:hypothetical protein
MQVLQAALGSTTVLLYNEQYIIKPPCSSGSAFGWHYDSQQCSAQCDVQYSPYLSLWIALDDIAENGCLLILPGSRANRQCTNKDCSSSTVPGSSAGQGECQPQQMLPDTLGVQYIEANCSEALLTQLDMHYKQPARGSTADTSLTASAGCHGAFSCLQDTASSCHMGRASASEGTGCAVGLKVPAGTAVSCWESVLLATMLYMKCGWWLSMSSAFAKQPVIARG